MSVVVTKVKRIDEQILTGFSKQLVATVHEAQGRKGLLASYMRPIYRPCHIVGSAITCEVSPGDNWMIHVAVEQCRKNDILIVTPTSPCTDGYFGDLLAESLKSRGVLGLIIDAGVRDIAALKDMPFPVWSKAISAQGTVKETIANVNVPVLCAGVSISPGDLIIADDDGVVVVPHDNTASVLENAKKREENETQKRMRLRAGELGLDIYDMRARLKSKGLRYIDSLEDRE